MRGALQPWLSTMATNAAIALVIVGMMWLVGVTPFLLVHLPITLLASSIGVWLFYVQHQFEDTYWAGRRPGACTRRRCMAARITTCRASCAGSRPISACITCTISPAASPIYRLPRVLRDHPELRGVGRLTLWQSLGCVRLVLWDEARRRLISFRELRRSMEGREALNAAGAGRRPCPAQDARHRPADGVDRHRPRARGRVQPVLQRGVHGEKLAQVPGFLSCGRYMALRGGPKYLAMYELEDHNVLEHRGLPRPHCAIGPRRSGPSAAGGYIGRNYLINGYRQIYPEPAPPRSRIRWAPCRPTCRWAASTHCPQAFEDEFNAWYNTAYIPGLSHRARMPRARAASSPSKPAPKYLTVYEFAQRRRAGYASLGQGPQPAIPERPACAPTSSSTPARPRCSGGSIRTRCVSCRGRPRSRT